MGAEKMMGRSVIFVYLVDVPGRKSNPHIVLTIVTIAWLTYWRSPITIRSKEGALRKDQVTYVRQAATGGMLGAGLCMLLELHDGIADVPSAVHLAIAALTVVAVYRGAKTVRRKGRG